MSENRRPRRIAESVRSYLAEQLRTHSEDPRLAHVVITNVEMPPDLTLAWVSVRLLVGDDDPVKRKRCVQALQRGVGRFRGGLGRQLQLRRVPELRFRYDEGHDAERRVNELLDEIAHEPKAVEDAKDE